MIRTWPLGITLAVALPFAGGCSSTDDPTSPSAFDFARPRPNQAAVSVAGRTIDYRTNRVVPNVPVAFGNFGPSGSTFVAQVTTTSDASGAYQVTLAPGFFLARVGDGSGLIEVKGPVSTEDFFVGVAGCVARYGRVTDNASGLPIPGVRMTLAGATATTDADGSYRLDVGCSGGGGFNTTFMYLTHPEYPSDCRVEGRGVSGVSREDVSLARRVLSSCI